jgi:hypothetical protein
MIDLRTYEPPIENGADIDMKCDDLRDISVSEFGMRARYMNRCTAAIFSSSVIVRSHSGLSRGKDDAVSPRGCCARNQVASAKLHALSFRTPPADLPALTFTSMGLDPWQRRPHLHLRLV